MELSVYLTIMNMSKNKMIVGDSRWGCWCKGTDSWCSIKDDRGKWHRYYYNQYRDKDGNPDFKRISEMFYRDSGCIPTNGHSDCFFSPIESSTN